MYLYSYPSTHGKSGLGCRRCLRAIQGAPENEDQVNSEVPPKAVIEQVWRCTWRPWWCELGGHNWASLEIHSEAVIEQAWRYEQGGHEHAKWRPKSSEFEDSLGGSDQASMEMHLEAMIQWVWRCTWMPWSSEIEGVLAGGQRTARRVLRQYSSVSSLAIIGMLRCDYTFELSWIAGWCQSFIYSGTPEGKATFSGVLLIMRIKGRKTILGVCCAWWMLYWVNAGLGECGTGWMLYSVNAVLSVCCTLCQLMTMEWRDRARWLNFGFYNDDWVVDEKERDGGWGRK